MERHAVLKSLDNTKVINAKNNFSKKCIVSKIYQLKKKLKSSTYPVKLLSITRNQVYNVTSSCTLEGSSAQFKSLKK